MFKKLLKKLYPPPVNMFRAETSKIRSEINDLRSEIVSQKNMLARLESLSLENVWANIFHDTTVDSNWLNDKVFWPGRAALGYQAMYVAYRVLNEMICSAKVIFLKNGTIYMVFACKYTLLIVFILLKFQKIILLQSES